MNRSIKENDARLSAAIWADDLRRLKELTLDLYPCNVSRGMLKELFIYLCGDLIGKDDKEQKIFELYKKAIDTEIIQTVPAEESKEEGRGKSDDEFYELMCLRRLDVIEKIGDLRMGKMRS